MRTRIGFCGLPGAGVLGALLLCGPSLNGADAPPATEATSAAVQRGNVTRFVTLPGTVRANQQATLYAKVGGYVTRVVVDKGDRVKTGDILAEIEVPELIADRKKIEAGLKVAEIDLNRLREARDKAPDLVLPQALDAAQGRLDEAKASLERIDTLLGFAKITAPFDGVVTARLVDPGAFVPAATSGSPAQTAALFTVMDFSTVRVQVPMTELEVPLVAKGEPVQVLPESLPGRSFAAVVSRMSYALDDATKTMLVEADLANPSLELRPGMYAQVKVGVEQHTNTLVVPAAALVTEKAATAVFKLVDGKARRTPVKAGFNDGQRVEVLSGVTEGETVLVPAKLPLADGQPVKVEGTK